MVFWTRIKKTMIRNLAAICLANLSLRLGPGEWESTFCKNINPNLSMGFRKIKIPFMLVIHDDHNHNEKENCSQELRDVKRGDSWVSSAWPGGKSWGEPGHDFLSWLASRLGANYWLTINIVKTSMSAWIWIHNLFIFSFFWKQQT